MKIVKTIKRAILLLITSLILITNQAQAGHALGASGDASEDFSGAALHLAFASACFSAASLYLSGDVAITIGKPVAEVVIDTAEISGDAITFSTDVIVDGIVTTAKLSSDLTKAGVRFSADSAALAANAVHAGIHISTDTAELFLNQAVNIAAASGRLSGEVAELAIELTAAGVELSADTTVLITNAGKVGIHLSEEAAESIVAASLEIAAECIESAVITERYILMTLEEANQLFHEVSLATVNGAVNATQKTYTFTIQTGSHLKSLGIDAAKYSAELTKRAAKSTVKGVTNTIKGADDAIVVVINSGSGLIVASLDSLTEAVEKTTERIK